MRAYAVERSDFVAGAVGAVGRWTSTIEDIGAELGVTESRACQLAKQGTARMCQRLTARR